MSKGHAFVQFQKPEDSIKANEKFNNYQIENRPLRIDWDEGLQYKREHYNPGAGAGAGAAGVRARFVFYFYLLLLIFTNDILFFYLDISHMIQEVTMIDHLDHPEVDPLGMKIQEMNERQIEEEDHQPQFHHERVQVSRLIGIKVD